MEMRRWRAARRWHLPTVVITLATLLTQTVIDPVPAQPNVALLALLALAVLADRRRPAGPVAPVARVPSTDELEGVA